MPTIQVTPGWGGPSAGVGAAPIVVRVAGVGPPGSGGGSGAAVSSVNGRTGDVILPPAPAVAVSDLFDLTGGWRNVRDYGATGDGTTNDTAAVQAALTAAANAGGGVVWLPRGTFACNTLAQNAAGGVSLIGAGRGVSMLKSRAAEPLLTITQDGTYPATQGTVERLTLDGNSLGTVGLDATLIYQFGLYDLEVKRFATYGIRHLGSVVGVHRRVTVTNCPTGVYADAIATTQVPAGAQANLVRFDKCNFYNCTGWGINWNRGAMLRLTGCNFEFVGTVGNANTGGVRYGSIGTGGEGVGVVGDGCWWERASGTMLRIEASGADTWHTLTGCLMGYGTNEVHGVYVDGSGSANHLTTMGCSLFGASTGDVTLSGAGAFWHKGPGRYQTTSNTGGTVTTWG
jgi:hypothetical protein